MTLATQLSLTLIEEMLDVYFHSFVQFNVLHFTSTSALSSVTSLLVFVICSGSLLVLPFFVVDIWLGIGAAASPFYRRRCNGPKSSIRSPYCFFSGQ